jgi:hypothetical protein
MGVLREAVSELVGVFRRNPDKHEAHRVAAPLMEQISRDERIITAMLERYLSSPASLDCGNYPVVALPVDLNPWFGINANCWIPLPDRNTDLSTKAIHHHGKLLLTTATLFGPGYEHWTFTTPKELDAVRGLYAMDLIEAAPHPLHHVAFVDSFLAHTPFYPNDLSITLAVFSNSEKTTWRDRAKRLPGVRGREQTLRRLATALGLGRALDLKIVESFDFYPTDEGFRVIRERKEFALGPTADHVASVFYVIQQTGNEQLARVIRRHLEAGRYSAGVAAIQGLLRKLERGLAIEPRLSPGHYDRGDANFTSQDIQRALRATRKGSDGGRLASAQVDQAALGAAAE